MKQKATWTARVGCWPASWFGGKLPTFVKSETDANGVVMVASKWSGGKRWDLHQPTMHPVSVKQGVC